MFTLQDYLFATHKDHPGSYETITGETGNIVEKLSFDPCLPVRNEMEAGGRRHNPTDWTFNNMPNSYLFDRGYTGHEHLDNFDLVNMNGPVFTTPYSAILQAPTL
ncbi:MAG: hypothetical protein L3J66_04895 [Bacteroidales bacterium]|nr:hypothetical protein [Bacteroidales bacterium]